jgi:membrane-bound inhibitor of C-type lysozyme
MSGGKKLKALAAAFCVLFLLNSCTEFFSTTWGDALKRDVNKVNVTTDNVDELLKVAKGNQELSKAILNKIAANPSNDTLRRAAIKAGNQAAGISARALENIGDLIDAADNGEKDALENLGNKILNDMASNDIKGIGKQLTGILKDAVDVDSVDPKTALIHTEKIAVSVPRENGNGTATITFNVGDNGKGTATISTSNGTSVYYDCEIKNNGTIALSNPEDNSVTNIAYTISDERTLTLTDLDAISGANLAKESYPSADTIATGRPEFKAGFINSVPGSDLTPLVMTLILAKVEIEKEKHSTGDLTSYLNSWSNKNVQTGKNLDDEELVIAAIVNAMIERKHDMTELTDMVKDLLGVK